MRRNLRSLAVPAPLLLALARGPQALAQKSGGVLRIPLDGYANTMMVNGNFNGWRLEDAWPDQ